MKRQYRLILTALTCLSLAPLQAAVPLVTGYQGRVQVEGTEYTGTGQFKFALIAKPIILDAYFGNVILGQP